MELRVLVAGVEYRTTDKYSIMEQSGAVATSTIPVRLDSAVPPLELSLVQVFDPDNVLFYSGIVQSVDYPEYSSRYETKVYTLTVAGLNCIFNNRLVSESLVNKYTHEIVDTLFDSYLAEEGLTKGVITQFTRRYDKYIANRLKLSDVLIELGDAVGAIPIITPDKVFHFIDKTAFPTVQAPAHITGLKKASNAASLRTVQFLSGASEDTTLQTKTFTWAAGQTEIPLAYQISSVVGVSINGTPCGVGITGLDSGDVTKTFLWKYGQQNMALNASASFKPVAGDTVAVVYYGYYAIEVSATNDALKSHIQAINGTSGKIEVCNVDQTITSTTDGENASADLLNTNGEIEAELTLTCHDFQASSVLNTWQLDYPDLYIGGDFVVVERTITDFYGEFRILVKLKNKGFVRRYGTVYNKNNKVLNNLTVRADDLVQKYNTFSDAVSYSDAFDITNGGQTCYPAASAGEIFAVQNLGDFYPV